ncbi:hypothetical protein GW17_00042497 [Ensete ventricosum]|nr:hypothetical protein GW17_00042497 [Ensete ventricosum]
MTEIDCRRSKSTVGDRFWRYRPVAGGPHTGNMADRYVPLVSGGTDQNCKPCYDVLTEVTHGEIRRVFRVCIEFCIRWKSCSSAYRGCGPPRENSKCKYQ